MSDSKNEKEEFDWHEYNTELYNRLNLSYEAEQKDRDKYTFLASGTIFSVTLASLDSLLITTQDNYNFLLFISLAFLASAFICSFLAYSVNISAISDHLDEISKQPEKMYHFDKNPYKTKTTNILNYLSGISVILAVVFLFLLIYFNKGASLC